MSVLALCENQPVRECSIEGCEREHYARDVCEMHYARARKIGFTAPAKEERRCTVEGCERPHRARGYCKTHYKSEWWAPRQHVETRICEVCDEDFTAHPENAHRDVRFCSSVCRGLGTRGELSWHWRGGDIPEDQRLRNSLEYAAWRSAIYTRDDFTCQLCGIRGGPLNADHIKPFALFPELRLELSNGRTLCEPCHRATPTYGVRTRRLAS